jgi:UDP-3-O-[3-hydroxymyristoyl] glucosamine N-acyltransferase
VETSPITAGALAERFGLILHGDGGAPVHGVATLSGAGPGQLAFLANPRYRAQLRETRASVVVVRDGDADAAPGPH